MTANLDAELEPGESVTYRTRGRIHTATALFFGTIVATVTTYFMRPMQRPARRIIDTIEYNLEQLEDLSVDELELLRKTTDSLIEHMERLKTERLRRRPVGEEID